MGGDAPSTKQIAVTAIDDKSVEQTVETFSGLAAGLTTTAITGAGATGTVAVTDNDFARANLTTATSNVSEAVASVSRTIVLTLETHGTVGDDELTQPITVSVSSSGTATNASPPTGDYSFTSPTNLLFSPFTGASSSQPVSLSLHDDITEESDETV